MKYIGAILAHGLMAISLMAQATQPGITQSIRNIRDQIASAADETRLLARSNRYTEIIKSVDALIQRESDSTTEAAKSTKEYQDLDRKIKDLETRLTELRRSSGSLDEKSKLASEIRKSKNAISRIVPESLSHNDELVDLNLVRDQADAKLKEVIESIESIRAKRKAISENEITYYSQLEVGVIGKFYTGVGFKVSQHINDSSFLAYMNTAPEPVIIRGFGVKNVPDGEIVTISRLFKVTKTESYTTVMGSTKTVFVIEPYEFPDDGL